MIDCPFYPALHIALSDEAAHEELRDMEPLPAQVITIDLNLPGCCMATELFNVAHTRGPSPFSVLVILRGLLRSRSGRGANHQYMNHLLCLPPHDEEARGFWHRLRNVAVALVRQPRSYQRSTDLLETLTDRLKENADAEREVARRAWRR